MLYLVLQLADEHLVLKVSPHTVGTHKADEHYAYHYHHDVLHVGDRPKSLCQILDFLHISIVLTP